MQQLRRAFVVSLALAAGLLTTSCDRSQNFALTPTPFTVEPAGEGSASTLSPNLPAPRRKENDRGDLVKEVGEVAGMTDPRYPAEIWAQFKVTDIKGAVCTGDYSYPPPAGKKLVQLHIQVETNNKMREFYEQYRINPVALFFHADWFGYASNGTTMNSVESLAASTCLSSDDQLPDLIGPAERAVGSVVLEVSDSSGELAWRPSVDDRSRTGWTWSYDISGTQ